VPAFLNSLADKNCFIVNSIFLANLAQTIIPFKNVFEQCIADVFCRQLVVLAHDATPSQRAIVFSASQSRAITIVVHALSPLGSLRAGAMRISSF
jgi:hypothetical protein